MSHFFHEIVLSPPPLNVSANDEFAFFMLHCLCLWGLQLFADVASVCSGDWVCSLCRDVLQPEVQYDCESVRTPGEHTAATYGLAACDQRVSAHRDLSPFLRTLTVTLERRLLKFRVFL